jgi:hypothetical protein
MADRWEKFTEPKEPKLPKAPEAKIITEKVVTKMEKADKIQKLKDSQKMPDYNKVINQRIEEIKAKNMPKQEPTLEQKISDKKKEYSNYLQKSMPTGIGVLLKKCIDGVRSGKLKKNAPPPPPMPPAPVPAPPPPSGPALNSGAVSAFQRGFLGG